MDKTIKERLKERLNTIKVKVAKEEDPNSFKLDFEKEYIETPLIDLIIDKTLEDAYKNPSIEKLLKINALIEDKEEWENDK